MSKTKVLVIRFNSIGDIVLSSVVIENLAKAGFEVHYLLKAPFSSLVALNPNVHKTWLLQASLSKVVSELKKENFDLVIDLHNNFRSLKVKMALGVKSFTLNKNRIGLLALTQFSIPLRKVEHIVDRYLAVIQEARIPISTKSLNFYFPPESNFDKLEEGLPNKFICIALGAAWATKQIPSSKLVAVINGLREYSIVLLGGKDVISKAEEIEQQIQHKVINKTGVLSLSESAWLIKRSSVLLTGDSGMMHIAAALDKAQVAVFGSTHPVLGYTPYYRGLKSSYTLVQNVELNCRPCTKQGKAKCPKGHFKCMLDLSESLIIDEIKQLI